MTPAHLQALRDTLPPFEQAVPPRPPMRDFCHYYGIDFEVNDDALQHLVGTVPSGAYQLCVHLWRRPDAIGNLLLLHGYFDHTGLFGKLIDYGLSRNYNVLMFDLPGHGLSSGEMAAIGDFVEYSQAIADVLAAVELPDLPLWVMAQSTGCAALFDYAGNHAWPFFASVLLAPLVRPAGWQRVRLAHTLLRHFCTDVPRKFNVNSSDELFLEFIQNDPLQSKRMPLCWLGALRRWLGQLPIEDLQAGPALVLQGDADTTVDWKYNVGVVCKLFPASTVEYLPGAGHQLANESRAIRVGYYTMIDAWLAAGSATARRADLL